MTFVGKKLLVLGGIERTKFLIKQAQKLGAYVIVADINSNAPGMKIADKAVTTNAIDVDAIVDLAKREQIDGIVSAHSDLLLRPWYEAAKRLGLPCYLTEEMIDVSTDKEKFNQMCRRYDIPVPKSYEIDEENLEESLSQLEYPVFIKPLDGSGSRGASACEKKSDFKELYYKAKKYSKTGRVIVEDKLSGTDIGVDYLIKDGEPYQISMHDRQMCAGRPSAVNHSNLQILPSKHLAEYKNVLDEKVKHMIREMNFKNGIVFFQGFADPNRGGIVFFEMGCRLGSTWNYIDEYFLGINPINCLVSYALMGSMGDGNAISNINPQFHGYGAVISLLTEKEKGSIAKIQGFDELSNDDRIKCIMLPYSEGDSFALGNATDIALARFQIAANEYKDLIDAINMVYEKVDFLDDLGQTLLSEVYSTDLLDYV